MKKKIKNFVKNIENIKEKNSLDLSVGEDLSIGLMNLISLEEHFLFSYMKTQNEKYLEFLEQTREIRKKLLAKIVKRKKGDYGEKWCISKHLLATSMRLTEVGTKYLHDQKKKEAEEIFIDAFNVYSLFWAVNDFGKLKEKTKVSKSKLSIVSDTMKKLLDCCKE
ncbi:hypothetical protein GOV12_04145 [Candidatus Pacearchaeota archaeon]|nr:hypothetical protein [Candidatus Pacearchaeota archaeon]